MCIARDGMSDCALNDMTSPWSSVWIDGWLVGGFFYSSVVYRFLKLNTLLVHYVIAVSCGVWLEWEAAKRMPPSAGVSNRNGPFLSHCRR